MRSRRSLELALVSIVTVLSRKSLSFNVQQLAKRQPLTTKRCLHHRNDESLKGIDNARSVSPQRRHLLGLPISLLGTLAINPFAVNARGLVQFPSEKPLLNRYHLMRAGTSLLEDEEDIWSTNPLFLTNRVDGALSNTGRQQVEATARQFLYDPSVAPTIVHYSLAASCTDTANIISRELRMGRDRIIPEYTFLDPRALGAWDMLRRSDVSSAVYALDADGAGPVGDGGRPPPNQDGTPNETLADLSVRLRQLMSACETQYSGDTILLIFPDGTGPALLTAMMAGIPYNRVHEMEFGPAQLSLNVNRETARKAWKATDDYKQTLSEGRIQLQGLLSHKSDEIVSRKDEKIETERIVLDAQAKQKQLNQERKDRKNRQDREDRQKEIAENQDNSLANQILPTGVLLLGAGISARAMMDGTSEESTELDDERTVETTVATNVKIHTTNAAVTFSVVENDIDFTALENLGEQASDEVSAPTIAEPPAPPVVVGQTSRIDPDQDATEAWLGSIAEIMGEEMREANAEKKSVTEAQNHPSTRKRSSV